MKWIKTKYGLLGMLVVLAAMLCSVPTYAEEPFQERNESVEEVLILVAKKQQEVNADHELSTTLLPPSQNRQSTGEVARGFVTPNRLYILYGSLRLYN